MNCSIILIVDYLSFTPYLHHPLYRLLIVFCSTTFKIAATVVCIIITYYRRAQFPWRTRWGPPHNMGGDGPPPIIPSSWWAVTPNFGSSKSNGLCSVNIENLPPLQTIYPVSPTTVGEWAVETAWSYGLSGQIWLLYPEGCITVIRYISWKRIYGYIVSSYK